MPTIDPTASISLVPNFDTALKAAGIIKKTDGPDLSGDLERVGLTGLEVLNTVANEMRSGETSQVRLKAAEIGLKLNGYLKGDDSPMAPHVTIVIKDSQYTEINPILIPR